MHQAPFTVELNEQLFCVNQVQGQLVAYPAHCPHMMAPLAQVPVVDGILECPWHAYRFDVRSGACVSVDILAHLKEGDSYGVQATLSRY